MERYHSPGFVEEKRKLAEWLCLPSDNEMGGKGKGLRYPATQTALAVELGVSKEVLSRWQRDPNFIALKHAVKKQVTLDLEDEFLHRMTIALLKPGSNYDRIFMVWERYAKPALQDEKERGEWDKFLPQKGADSQKRKRAYTQMLTELRSLPIDQREIFLNLLDKAIQAESEDTSSEPDTFSPRYIPDDEPAPEPAAKALPAPDPQADTTPAPAYNPRLRKPLRKPKH